MTMKSMECPGCVLLALCCSAAATRSPGGAAAIIGLDTGSMPRPQPCWSLRHRRRMRSYILTTAADGSAAIRGGAVWTRRVWRFSKRTA